MLDDESRQKAMFSWTQSKGTVLEAAYHWLSSVEDGTSRCFKGPTSLDTIGVSIGWIPP